MQAPAAQNSPTPAPQQAPTPLVPNAPSAPLLAQGTGSNLTVTWTAPAIDSTHNAATGFNLQSSPSGAGTWTTVSGVSSPYVLSGLAAGAAIDVQIQSSNAAGTSAWSASNTLTTATTAYAPNTPSAPLLAQGTGTNLTVTWAAPAIDSTHNAATGFNLQYSPSGAGMWTTVSRVTSPYTLSGLAAGAATDVQVQSLNVGGTSAWSGTGTLTTAGPFAPNVPSALSLAQGTGSNLAVTWTAPAVDNTHGAAAGYNLRSSPSGAGTWTTVSGVTSPYTLSGLAAGAAFDVQVQSSDGAGVSAWSGTTTLTTAGPFAPNVPNTLSVTQGTGSNLTVAWTAPAVDNTHGAAAGYNLRSSPSGAGTWTVVSGVTNPYTLSGLAAGAPYDVQVQSSDIAGVSAWSATTTLTTAVSTGPFAPNAPAITSVAPPVDGTNTKLTVIWTAPTVDSTHGAATGYNLRWSPSGAGTWTTLPSVTSPYTLTGLAGATAIDFEVQGTDAAASPGAWSAITTGTTWGATVAPTSGGWAAAATQVHNTSVAPNGGAMLTAAAAPTAVTGAAFAWSSSNSTVPTTGLIACTTDGQTNGWAAYFSAPATAGAYYLWMLAQAGTVASPTTIGAFVTTQITVS
jgi:Fibronectin type III domain